LGRLTRVWPRCLGSDRAGLVDWVERREGEAARIPKEGGREGEAAMIPMCADWVGKGCSMQSSTERLNSNPCAPHEAREARDFLRASRGKGGKGLPSLSKSSIRSTDGPKQDRAPLYRAPFLCWIARALRFGLYHAPVRIYRDKPVRPALVIPRRVVLASPPSPAGTVNSHFKFLPGVSSEPGRPVRCCTLPANQIN
jgi:hypothetical protein